MFENIKEILNPETVSSRRMFIKSAGALAALTASGPLLGAILKTTEIEHQISGGRIYGQTFYLTRPIVIDIPNVIIDNCTFILKNPMPCAVEISSSATNCRLQNCIVYANGYIDTVFKLNPQKGDMTTTFQSAFDTISDGAVYLPKGDYKYNHKVV